MEKVDERVWKAICNEVSKYRQVNSVDGNDGIRTYYNNKTVVARMRVINSESDIPGYECQRTFEASKKLIEASKKYYIPTAEEWDEWDDIEDDEQWLTSKGVI